MNDGGVLPKNSIRKWDLPWFDTLRNAERVGIAETPWSRVNYKRRCNFFPPWHFFWGERTRINDELQDAWRIVGFNFGLWCAGKDNWLTCFKLPKVRGSVTWRIMRHSSACIVSTLCIIMNTMCQVQKVLLETDSFSEFSTFDYVKWLEFHVRLSSVWLFPKSTSPRFFVRRRPGGRTHRRTWQFVLLWVLHVSRISKFHTSCDFVRE